MTFDFHTFFALKLQEARQQAGRAAWVLAAAQLIGYPFVHLFFELDDILHPEIRTVRVERPIFIVGCPRSGTTLLFHLLASDPSVASYNLHRMIYPSLTLRRVVPQRVLDWFANGLEAWFAGLDGIHPIRWAQPEEDEILFLSLGNSGINTYFFPYGDLVERLKLNRFWDWPAHKRAAYLRFYHRSLQRLLWDTGRSRYVGKSPHFLGKIDDLYRQYPDACFVYCVRSPYECIPSALSFIATMWKIAFPEAAPAEALRTLYRELVVLWRYGDGRVCALPERNRVVVHYADPVGNPHRVVRDTYAACGTAVSPEFDRLLHEASERQVAWRSRHRYSLDDFPVRECDLRTDLEPILARHGFV